MKETRVLKLLNTDLKKLRQKLAVDLDGSSRPLVHASYVLARRVVRRVVNTLSPMQLGWMSTVTSAHWLEGAVYEIEGWAYERGMVFGQMAPDISVALGGHRQPPVAVTVERVTIAAANVGLKVPTADFSVTGFRLKVDFSSYHPVIRVRATNATATGTFKRRAGRSSVFQLRARLFDGVEVSPGWTRHKGLVFRFRKPAFIATALELTGRELGIEIAPSAGDSITASSPAEGRLATPVSETSLVSSRGVDGTLRCEGEIPQVQWEQVTSFLDARRLARETGRPAPSLPDTSHVGTLRREEFFADGGESALPAISHQPVILTPDGAKHRLHAAPGVLAGNDQLPWPYLDADGTLRLLDTPVLVVVTQAESVTDPRLGVNVRGKILGNADGVSLALVGPRAQRPMDITIEPDGSFSGFASWLAPAWGRPGRPPMKGRYELKAKTGEGKLIRVIVTDAIATAAREKFVNDEFHCTIGVNKGRRLVFDLAGPQKDEEVGIYNQRRLQRVYHRPDLALSRHFYFESFDGKQGSDNPMGIDRALARLHPEIPRYWGVVDASVAVPEGAIPLVFRTEEWYRVRQTATWVVANEWLRNTFEHMPGQHVLQTWHGTMLKRIGLDRADNDITKHHTVLDEIRRWDYLLSQNPHSTEIFRSAYAWDREFWEEGYPRNDQLFTDSPEPIRELLGVKPGQKAILYAPTWREARKEMVTFLDAERLMAVLGDEYVLLLRGHSRTLKFGEDVREVPGVIDVTSYPNISELFLASDMLVTDYSSVMFDYSNLSRPMIFFVPDIDDYRDSRGVYFDLTKAAPGPLVMTQDEVVESVRSASADVPLYQARYDAWRARFNPWDSATCGERIVNRLLALAE